MGGERGAVRHLIIGSALGKGRAIDQQLGGQVVIIHVNSAAPLHEGASTRASVSAIGLGGSRPCGAGVEGAVSDAPRRYIF